LTTGEAPTSDWGNPHNNVRTDPSGGNAEKPISLVGLAYHAREANMADLRAKSLTLRELEIFAAVSQEGSFTKAARALFLSEPAVSEQVKRLEQLVGATLFARTARKPIRVTKAGEKLLEATDAVFERLGEALHEINALQRAAEGHVAFGAGHSFGGYLVPSIHAAFRESSPDINLQVDFGVRQYLLDGVRRRDLDVAVVDGPDEGAPLTWAPLGDYHLVLVGRPGHRLARNGPVGFEELVGEPIIMGKQPSSARQALERNADMRGIQLHFAWEVQNLEAWVQAAISGFGITMVPFYAVASRVAAGTCSVLQIEGFPLTLQWFVVSVGDELPPPPKAFREFLLGRRRELQDAARYCG
jgi:DNA-binding transcriptional LysR family regulator